MTIRRSKTDGTIFLAPTTGYYHEAGGGGEVEDENEGSMDRQALPMKRALVT